MKTKDGYIIRIAFPDQQLYNKIMKKFSKTAYVIFPSLERDRTVLSPLSHSKHVDTSFQSPFLRSTLVLTKDADSVVMIGF